MARNFKAPEMPKGAPRPLVEHHNDNFDESIPLWMVALLVGSVLLLVALGIFIA